jgi:type I restriction enzyme S subunit
MRLREQSVLKESCLKHIGMLPQSWNCSRRLRHVFDIKKGRNPTSQFEDNGEGRLPYLTAAYLRGGESEIWVPNDGLFSVEGNILLLWDGSNAGEFFKSKTGIVSSTFALLSTNEKCSQYFWYLLKSFENYIKDTSIGMGIPHVNGDALRDLKIPTPSLIEQQAIAEFLDKETAKIDKSIQMQEILIEELKEKRYSEISNAVSFGVNQNCEMVKCDHEWLVKIPKHWEFKKLKHIANIFASNVDKKTIEGQHSIKLCNYTDVYYSETITSEIDFMEASATDDQIAKFSLKANDVIITKDSETPDDIGISSFVPKDIPGVICGYHLSIVRPNNGISGAFIKRLFDSFYVKSSWTTLANGVTRYGLGQYSIDNLKVPVPPYDEQIQIVSYLDILTKNIDALIDKSKLSINLLKEHRSSLIFAAVTGKIDVRELT